MNITGCTVSDSRCDMRGGNLPPAPSPSKELVLEETLSRLLSCLRPGPNVKVRCIHSGSGSRNARVIRLMPIRKLVRMMKMVDRSKLLYW
jgi:hypothetical protein